jgi:hypothetical protein
MKKWLFGLLSLIMLLSSVAIVAMPNFSNFVCEDGEIQVTAPKDNQDKSEDKDDDEPDNPQEPQPSEEDVTTYEFRTYNDYMQDYDLLKGTITEYDLSGTGTEQDPYVIHNERGFAYLRSIKVHNKFVELDNDLQLNDETFDKDGNPSGGDGVVYVNRDRLEWFQVSFNGNGHLISGFYANYPEKAQISLFGAQNQKDIRNLYFKNFYIKAKQLASSIVYRTVTIENVTVGTGRVISLNASASGLVSCANEIYNCVNYADVESVTSSCAGGIYSEWGSPSGGVLIDNCVNYGTIKAKTYASGICANPASNAKVINCKNYGDCISWDSTAGGICGAVYVGRKEIINCKNYGRISSSWFGGGIVGYIVSDAVVRGCENYGDFLSTYCSGITYAIYKYAETREAPKVLISDCKVYNLHGKSSNSIGKVIDTINGKGTDVTIDNIYFEVENFKVAQGHVIREITNVKLRISNFEVVQNTDKLIKFNQKFSCQDFVFNNILWKSSNKYNKELLTNLRTVNAYNFILLCSDKKLFKGNDFSNFSYNNKTGKISLGKASNVGSLQLVEINKYWLFNKNFEEVK